MHSPERSPVLNDHWQSHHRFYDYTSAANPRMPDITIQSFPSSLHHCRESKTIPLDLSTQLETPYPATGPNLLANFVHIASTETMTTETHASSQIFFVIRGTGHSVFQEGYLQWKAGDYFAIPASDAISHSAQEDSAFYWVHDQPLMDYLGAEPKRKRCKPLYFPADLLESELHNVSSMNKDKDTNRNGVLLANPDCPLTKTVTHTLWSLYNLLPANSRQKAHRHNSIALDYTVKARTNTYSLLGKELDSQGNIKHPVRVDWVTGGVFVTPPGWWHSHHNESDEDAIILPVQDAGLHTYNQSLDIRFSQGY